MKFFGIWMEKTGDESMLYSYNQKMPDSEVILFLETLLQDIKEESQKKSRENSFFYSNS